MADVADKWRPDPANVTYVGYLQRQLNLRTKGAAADFIFGIARKFGQAKDDKDIAKIARQLVLRPVGGKPVDVVAMTADELQSEIEELQAKLAMLDESQK